MMFLAPSPFVVVMQRSQAVEVATMKLRALLARSVQAEQLWRGSSAAEEHEAGGGALDARRAQFCSRILSVMMTIGAVGEEVQREGGVEIAARAAASFFCGLLYICVENP